MAASKIIYVYADWKDLKDKPVLMGTLTAANLRGKEIFSFEYTDSSLNQGSH